MHSSSLVVASTTLSLVFVACGPDKPAAPPVPARASAAPHAALYAPKNADEALAALRTLRAEVETKSGKLPEPAVFDGIAKALKAARIEARIVVLEAQGYPRGARPKRTGVVAVTDHVAKANALLLDFELSGDPLRASARRVFGETETGFGVTSLQAATSSFAVGSQGGTEGYSLYTAMAAKPIHLEGSWLIPSDGGCARTLRRRRDDTHM